MALRASLVGLARRITSPISTTTTTSAWARPFSSSTARFEGEPPQRNPTTAGVTLAPEWRHTKDLPSSLEAYSGRSIGNVGNSMQAFRRLNGLCNRNNIRREVRDNRYYEKPTVARRRKNIERNRKLFGAMVGKKVALIMQMKNRGM